MGAKIQVRRITDITLADIVTRKTARAQLDLNGTSKEQCKVCPKPVWFSAFFDGTGNNFDADGQGRTEENQVKYSNVAKLAGFAHVKRGEMPRTYLGYIEGVGTPCNKPGVNDSGQGLDGAMGMAAAAKGAARIEWMLQELQRRVAEHMPFVNQINIAVFGFSRGATLARAFVRKLAETVANWDGQNLTWRQAAANGEHPRVVVYFLGIFDTVASTGFGGSHAESMVKSAAPGLAMTIPVIGPSLSLTAGGVLREIDKGGHAVWAQDLAIPAYVQRCVHFLAGHELREKFPADSVRVNQVLPPNCEEQVYPGVHSDVGGGYAYAKAAYQEDRVNELARVPLCNMYIEAYKAGVPLVDPTQVLARSGKLFDISPELERVFKNYIDRAPVWINDKLETAVIWHMNQYYEWRESRRRRLADHRLNPVQRDSYMTITDDEWASDVQSIAKSCTGYLRSPVGVQKSAIFDAYRKKLISSMKPEERQNFDLFFDKYVHDSIAGFKKQMKEASSALAMTERSRWSINRKYFVGRRGNRYLYWRYESDGTAYADVKFDDNNVPENYDSPEARRARQGELESRDYQRATR